MAEMLLERFGSDAFDRAKFKTVANEPFWVKPKGGMWASPVGAEWGWRQWCEAEDFSTGDLAKSFRFRCVGNILTIDSVADMKLMPSQVAKEFTSVMLYSPDFERMLREGVDAIHLTEAGQNATRFSHPGLYGWDCCCVLVMNPDCVFPVDAKIQPGPRRRMRVGENDAAQATAV